MESDHQIHQQRAFRPSSPIKEGLFLPTFIKAHTSSPLLLQQSIVEPEQEDGANASWKAENFNFSSNDRGSFEPLRIDRHRTPQQHAALRCILEEAVDFLFGDSKKPEDSAALPGQSAESPLPLCTSENRQGTLSSSVSTNDLHGFNRKRKREDDSSASAKPATIRFRSYQTDQWDERLKDLLRFRRVHNHCCVPNDFPTNPTLARWVKRQRYQYKLFQVGKPSAMSDRRVAALEKTGFIWDAHTAAWERRLAALKAYRVVHGDCNVPVTYAANKKLARWVKCQRRQYKLYHNGTASTMTRYRIEALNRLGFEWKVRSLSALNPMF